ncbi:competence protein ComEC [Virgibacillus halotolerans]|uniref:DNA internalization-related competence protein ComEC/Rec2 n=1 Tax=Virgibacillus halotolerans TaxID=1071053 RepID=UPI001961498C|nr:DNA internalization-related competence protein ComEC/Rec2 [Virgibacillus halotolerans]MBM7597905.1 competence protein ComEC [Virgibacillus halotolerans]
MKGYWHFAAIAATMSMLTILFDSYWFVAGFFLWLFYLYYDDRLGKVPLFISLTCFLLFSLHIPSITADDSHTQTFTSSQIAGEIVSPIDSTEQKLDFVFADEQSKSKLLVVYFPDEEAPQNALEINPSLKYGASCVIAGQPELPEKHTNPGQFDYRHFLLTKGITHQLIVDSLDDITCTGSSFLHRIYKSRTALIARVEKSISKETAAWLNALVLGDDSLIDDNTVELFQKWSLSHILAISGLHVGLIVALMYFILIKLNLFTKEKAQWVMIFFLPFYALIAGGEPSVWRASTMVLMFIILNKTRMNLSVTDTLSIVFLLLILFDKYIVYHIGFQLSFIVTFGLILSRKWFSTTKPPLIQVLKISFVSQMMIVPLQIAYFSIFQPLSILLNFIIVPYFSLFVIPFMFILMLITIVFPVMITRLFDRLFVPINDTVISLIESIDGVADYPMIIGSFPIGAAIIYYVLFFVFMSLLQKEKLLHAFKYGCAFSILIICLAIRPYLSPTGTVTMLDMGQGDAFVIELPYRKGVIFMDAGARFSFQDMEPTDVVYKQVIKPYLYSRGINKIDAIFLSHEDLDHIGSVPFMVNELKVAQIIISDYYEISDQEAFDWQENNVKVERAAFGEQIEVGGQQFQVLSPMEKRATENENSLILYTAIGGKSWLFTGDVSLNEEKDLIETFPHLSVDVLKVAHHGSNTSTDPSFVEHIKPAFALISAGENNMYGHPTPEVIGTLDTAAVTILRTDEDGAVQYRFNHDEGTFYKFVP